MFLIIFLYFIFIYIYFFYCSLFNKINITNIIDFVKIEKNELRIIIEDKNIQEFEGLDFKIKIETLPTENNNI